MSIKDLVAGGEKIAAAFTKYSQLGDVVQGTILEADPRQETDYDTGEKLTWNDGNPREQVRIILQTELRDPQDPQDDGRRAVYVKWYGEQKKALLAALRAAGADDLYKGGTFAARFASTTPNSNPRLNDSKNYEYRYQAPPQGTGLDFGGEQVNTATGEISPSAPAQDSWGAPPAQAPGSWPAAQAPIAQQAPPAQPAQAPQPPIQAPPAQPPAAAAPTGAALVLQLHGLGLDAAAIQSTTGQSPEAIAAIIQQAGA